MTEQEIKTGLQQILDETMAVNSYLLDDHLLLQRINSLSQNHRQELYAYYKDKAGFIVNIRKHVAESLMNGHINIESVNEKLEEQRNLKPTAFRSYKNLYNILYPFVTVTHSSIHTFITGFLQQLQTDLGLADCTKSIYFDFQGARQQGSNRLWFAIYNNTQPDQSASRQIFGDFVDGSFSFGLYTHKTKAHDGRITLDDLTNFSYAEMVEHLNNAAEIIKNDVVANQKVLEIKLDKQQLFKLSHGSFKTAAQSKTLEEIKKRQWIVLHETTGYSHNGGDGDIFRDEIQIGDYVYITIGGNYLYNLARVTSDCDYVPQEVIDDDDGWLYREVEYLHEPVDSSIDDIRDYKTKTYPSYTHPLAKITDNVLEEMNNTLFVPHYNIKFIRSVNKSNSGLKMPALNTILYGPPGTGKTYKTIQKAVEIIAGESFEGRYDEAKTEYKKQFGKQVEFITFHQNYSYEDFVAGLRPDVAGDANGLKFKEYRGVFYRICQRATKNWLQHKQYLNGSTYIEPLFEEVLNEFLKPLIEEDEPIVLNTIARNIPFNIFAVNAKNLGLEKQSGSREHTLSINTLRNLYDGSRDYDLQGLGVYMYPVVDRLKQIAVTLRKPVTEVKLENYVLIIDEINRANISRVFGELITLLEEDKRLGATHELQLSLPGLPDDEPFAVPPNLYIIGTMNTADKSIALLDIALRRRFQFEGIYPDASLPNVQYADILTVLNEQIMEKKGSDFLIGHSFFMKSAGKEFDLAIAMNQKVIPLLNEYFYNQKGDAVKTMVEKAIAAHSNMKLVKDSFGQLQFFVS